MTGEALALPFPASAPPVDLDSSLGRRPQSGPTLVLDAGGFAAPSYRQSLEALGVAVYTTDADGRITSYNAAARALWGRSPELGEMWCGSWKLFWPSGEPMAHGDCPMAIALKTRQSVRGYEGVAERPDGTRVTFVPYPTIVTDRSGEMVGAVNVLVDVSDRRRAEDKLRAAIAVKDEFLGLVSHELRTPVTTIFGNAQMLARRTDLPAPLAGMLADIASEADRLVGVIENLLVLTKAGSGADVDHEPQVLDHVVAAAVAALARAEPARRVRVTGTTSGRVVHADTGYLDLLIGNLLSNANKYSPADELIEVVLGETEHSVELRVLDRGIGFEPGDAGALFDTFFRTAPAQRMASGLGLGLSACRRLVELLGGRIWAQPRPEGGSEFGFSLPSPLESTDTN